MEEKKIAVIGAGPMGLGIAYQLVKEGYKPIVFEADDRIGGMSASFNFGNIEIERYYHFHCTGDNDLINILSELNLLKELNWVHTRMGYYFNGIIQDWGDPISLLKFKGISNLSKLRYGLHAFFSIKRRNWANLDGIKAKEWITKWIGEEAYKVLWSKLFELKFYEYSGDISAAWIWSRMKRVGKSRYNIFKEKLGYLNGGVKTLLNEMKNIIETGGGVILLNNKVKNIIIENNKVKGIETNKGYYDCNVVISTIPIPLIPEIIKDLPETIRNNYKAVKNIGCVCVIIKLKKALTEYFWININDKEMDIPGIIEYSNLNPSVGHIIYVPYYMPQKNNKYQEADDIFIQKTISYLKQLNRDLNDEDIIDSKVNRYFYAQPVYTTNFLNALPDVKLPIDGLWIADTSYYYPDDRGLSESIGFGRKLVEKYFKINF